MVTPLWKTKTKSFYARHIEAHSISVQDAEAGGLLRVQQHEQNNKYDCLRKKQKKYNLQLPFWENSNEKLLFGYSGGIYFYNWFLCTWQLQKLLLWPRQHTHNFTCLVSLSPDTYMWSRCHFSCVTNGGTEAGRTFLHLYSCATLAVPRWVWTCIIHDGLSGFVLRRTQETRVNSLPFFFETTRAENPSSQCCGRHDDQSALLSSLGSLLSPCLWFSCIFAVCGVRTRSHASAPRFSESTAVSLHFCGCSTAMLLPSSGRLLRRFLQLCSIIVCLFWSS